MCLAGGHVGNRVNVHWMFQQLENETAWTSRSPRGGNPSKGKGHPPPRRPSKRRDARRPRCYVVDPPLRPSSRRLSRKVSFLSFSFLFFLSLRRIIEYVNKIQIRDF